MDTLRITALTPEQKKALRAFWKASQTTDESYHTTCLFCGGGNNCKCGGCQEYEWHDKNCPALLAYLLLDWIDDDMQLTMQWEWDYKD